MYNKRRRSPISGDELQQLTPSPALSASSAPPALGLPFIRRISASTPSYIHQGASQDQTTYLRPSKRQRTYQMSSHDSSASIPYYSDTFTSAGTAPSSFPTSKAVSTFDQQNMFYGVSAICANGGLQQDLQIISSTSGPMHPPNLPSVYPNTTAPSQAFNIVNGNYGHHNLQTPDVEYLMPVEPLKSENEARQERRMLQNREAQKKHRLKKLQEVKEMEDRLVALEGDNQKKQERIDCLEVENQRLKSMLQAQRGAGGTQ